MYQYNAHRNKQNTNIQIHTQTQTPTDKDKGEGKTTTKTKMYTKITTKKDQVTEKVKGKQKIKYIDKNTKIYKQQHADIQTQTLRPIYTDIGSHRQT